MRKCPRTWREAAGMKNGVGKTTRSLLNFQYARSAGDSLICVFNKSRHRIMPQIQMAEQCNVWQQETGNDVKRRISNATEGEVTSVIKAG